eukprot:COSAG06_NODE_63188_length_263_cov_0.603659_1_plen_57_part_01
MPLAGWVQQGANCLHPNAELFFDEADDMARANALALRAKERAAAEVAAARHAMRLEE